MRRAQVLAVALGLLIFGMGFSLGVLAHRLYDSSTVSAKTADDWRQRYVAEMQARLSLTPVQVDKLNDILDATREKYRAMRERHRPEMVQIKEQQIAEVKAILMPAQAAAYDKILSEREKRASAQSERERRIDQQRAAERQRREQQEQAPATK